MYWYPAGCLDNDNFNTEITVLHRFALTCDAVILKISEGRFYQASLLFYYSKCYCSGLYLLNVECFIPMKSRISSTAVLSWESDFVLNRSSLLSDVKKHKILFPPRCLANHQVRHTCKKNNNKKTNYDSDAVHSTTIRLELRSCESERATGCTCYHRPSPLPGSLLSLRLYMQTVPYVHQLTAWILNSAPRTDLLVTWCWHSILSKNEPRLDFHTVNRAIL